MSNSPYQVKYLPVPPRLWSRVQNECSLNLGVGNSLNYAVFDYKRQSLLKGNILQYKKNSSNLTKKQRYSQIAKGMWTNRTTTWATQSDSYTNPNTNSLRRVNFTIVDPSNNVYSNPPNPFFAYGCPIDAPIKDGGSLICSTTVNPCTDVVISQTLSQKLCNPTTDSDVPGQIMPLCWNDGDPTWYPRQRYTMSTSGDKWPVNSKFIISAIQPNPPILLSVTVDSNSAILEWESGNSDCYPVLEFLIYDNDILIQRVPFPTLTTRVTDLFNCSTNEFYVTAILYRRPSEPSNRLSAFIDLPYGPTITSYGTASCDSAITLQWEMLNGSCLAVTSYNIYDADTGAFIGSSLINSYSVPTIFTTACTSYAFYVTAIFSDSTESIKSNTVSVSLKPCPPVLSSSNLTSNSVDITWSNPTTTCNITSYQIYQGNSLLDTVAAGLGPYLKAVTGLQPLTTYTFFAYSLGTPNKSDKSTTISVTTLAHLPPTAPTNLSLTFCYKQATLSWTNTDPTITGYNLYLDNNATPVAIGVLTTSYLYTNLINGTQYDFKVSATNALSEESAKSSLTSTTPSTQSYFTLVNESSYEVTGPSYIVYFSAVGSLTYNTTCSSVNVTNCSITIVGGGGGGAGGKPDTNSGGGGAGGQVLVQSSITFLPSDIATVNTIGSGGNGGLYNSSGNPGGTTTVTINASTYTAAGGGGGNVHGGGGTGLGTSGGGGAFYNSGNGGDGTTGGTSLISIYGGAGGGGSYPTTPNLGSSGESGAHESGGAGGKKNALPSADGVSATTPGCGGGGGVSFDPYIKGDGGNGFQGIVKFVIPN